MSIIFLLFLLFWFCSCEWQKCAKFWFQHLVVLNLFHKPITQVVLHNYMPPELRRGIAVLFLFSLFRKISFKELKGINGKRYGVFSGLGNGIANFLTLVLAGMENASVLFPIVSAGTLLAALLCVRFLFKEKLKANHYVAIAAMLFKRVFFFDAKHWF